jgi:CheY-like chemotaxis protein/tRNA A-37 threonylcarbamoyl transferase component Bud32
VLNFMPENTVPTTATFASLAGNIIASGLVPSDELESILASANGDQRELEKLLSAKGLLTRFQISALRDGRGESLRIGNYDILDRLGAGGMGTVFKARHRRMKRVVALKVLSANLSTNPVFVKRFQREVETIASLGHPNVVMAYDADEAEVGHFLVMEFVSGRDLWECVEREGPFPVGHAVKCILQAARGLAYAHAQGIIHRDIKPHNLLRDENSAVKITDLGLARLNHGDEGPATGAEVTMAGGVIGTADYMPPEQAVDSTTIDHRADIYSLGCTLYYLLTGKPPFGGNTIMSILLKHREGEIPKLGPDRSDVPPELENLYRRMLAKKPEERVQSMTEVITELEAIARSLAPDESGNLHANMTVELPAGLAAGAGSTVALGAAPDQTLAIETIAKPITVLIVEPSRVQGAIIKGYLEEQSLSVVGTVVSGSNAIQAVRSLRPRAVVSAMHLADISGVELARQIRAEIKVDAPGFVLVTSETDEGESSSLSQLNRVLTLKKPFTAGQMAEALRVVTGASNSLKSGGKVPRSQLRVLIVDDSSTARIQVRTVLQGLGFSLFTEVPDGAYAIAVAARESCDLIVTDYNMPLMDGRALVSYLKQNPPTAAIPIVMVTTETEPRVLDPVRKLGVVAVLEKAFPANVVGPLLDSLFGSP